MSLRVQIKKREKEEQKRAEEHVSAGKNKSNSAFGFFFLCFLFYAPAGRGSIIGEALSLGALGALTDGIDDITGDKLKHEHCCELPSPLQFTVFPGECQSNTDKFDILASQWCIWARRSG